MSYLDEMINTRFSGQADYAIGIVTTPGHTMTEQFYPDRVVWERELESFHESRAELFRYMAAIRASRKKLGRDDLTVAGLVSAEGYCVLVELEAS